MPTWFKQALFILIFLVALANFREIGDGVSQLAHGLGQLFTWEVFHYEDPVIRFLVFGILCVVAVALFALHCQHRGSSKDNGNGSP